MQPDTDPPEDEPRPRPAWLRWTMIVGAVVLLLCCLGCGVELIRFFGWLSSSHPS